MNDYPDIPLTDSIDIAILMHRDAHFGGRFEFMIDYYQKEGKGTVPEFDMIRIMRLNELENRMQQNLAAIFLTGPDAEKVSQAKDAYKKLRSLYEKSPKESAKTKIPLLIADLILAEEEDPEKEINAIVAEKGAAVPFLIDLLRAEDFYDPLFPGYGRAPELAVKCLGRIGDKRAIIALFEAIGESDFFSEDLVLEALKAIGTPAKEFLLKVLHGKPLNFDNERAAIALEQFKDNPEVAEACFSMLKELDLKKNGLLAEYLALDCEGLKSKDSQKAFKDMSEASTTPTPLRQDMQFIAKQFENKNT